MSSLAARLTVTFAAPLRVSMLVGEKLKAVSRGGVVSEAWHAAIVGTRRARTKACGAKASLMRKNLKDVNILIIKYHGIFIYLMCDALKHSAHISKAIGLVCNNEPGLRATGVEPL
jgi:hypothetical protein